MESIYENHKIEHIYIHIPFCEKKCSYCSFYSTTKKAESINEYLFFLKKEIKYYHKIFTILPRTIYFGGGTPSLLSDNQINEILELFDTSQAEEITLECNPIHINKEYIQKISKTKINRISMGIQSLIDKELTLLGRLHSAQNAIDAYKTISEHFHNISIDLMYGLPKQSIESLQFSLNEFIKLHPKHISTYCLSLEKDVPLYKFKHLLPNDKTLEKMYFLIKDTLEKYNYHHYEISNFAQKGYHSQHNSSYWLRKNYLGCGASAAGFVNNFRYENPANLSDYEDMIRSNNYFLNKEILTESDALSEFIFLHLRTLKGLNISEINNLFKIDFLKLYSHPLNKLLNENLLIYEQDTLRLSRKALFISDGVMAEFM